MREILFRGKRPDNGEWVYGYYVHIGPVSCQRTYIIPEYASALYVNEVYPSTVGQYTGLNDKHGKRIFENGYMIIDKQTYKVLFDNGEYILKNIFNCDTIQLKNNSNIGVFVDEI